MGKTFLEELNELFDKANKSSEILETFSEFEGKMLLERANILPKSRSLLQDIPVDDDIMPNSIVEVLRNKKDLSSIDSDILIKAVNSFDKLIDLLKQFKEILPEVQDELYYYVKLGKNNNE